MMALALFGLIIGIAGVGTFFYYQASKKDTWTKPDPEKLHRIENPEFELFAGMTVGSGKANVLKNQSSRRKSDEEEPEPVDDGMVREHGYPVSLSFRTEEQGIYHNAPQISDRGWQDLEYTIAELGRLPSDAAELLDAINSPNSSASDIAEVCRKSVGFTARILKLVNSPFYGLRFEVVDVQQAVALLGYDEMRQVIYTSSIFRDVNSVSDQLNVNDLWKHSLAVSRITNWLSEKIKTSGRSGSGMEIRDGLAGTSAMLHDIGKLVLQRWRPVGFRNALRTSKMNSTTLMVEELKELGLTHALAGELLLNYWHLPKSLAVVVKGSHLPMVWDDLPEASLIWLAGQIARYLSLGIDGETFRDSIPSDIQALLGIEADTVNDLVSGEFRMFVQNTLADLHIGVG